MINSKLNKIAWKIRRSSATKFNCKVIEISWKKCLQIAFYRINKKKLNLDNLVRKHSAFNSFTDLMQSTIKHGYYPSFNTENSFERYFIAEKFDKACNKKGINKRAYRW